LVSRGIQIAPIVLHTGVASGRGARAAVPGALQRADRTAWQVNAARAAGGRVVAVGTTAVRALESAADRRGVVRPAQGWTELVITPERGVRAVDGLLTGLHEPAASHLLRLRGAVRRPAVERVYAEACAAGISGMNSGRQPAAAESVRRFSSALFGATSSSNKCHISTPRSPWAIAGGAAL